MIPTLATPRFTLRPLRRTDAAALFPTLSDEAQCRYLTREAFASEEELWSWLADPDWNGRTWIAEDGEGRVAARVVAVPGNEKGVAEIGYITCMHRRGEGVARECSTALIEHLFAAEGHRKLCADVDPDNAPSIRLLETLGFTREAHLREHETTHIGVRDVLVYGLLCGEWG